MSFSKGLFCWRLKNHEKKKISNEWNGLKLFSKSQLAEKLLSHLYKQTPLQSTQREPNG